MQGVKVELLEMLEARDRRYELQQKLLTEYKKPLISFTMNIAGPIKNNDLIRWAFDYGTSTLEGLLRVNRIEVLCKEVINEVTGNEAFYVVSDTWQNSAVFFEEKRKDTGKNNSWVSDTQQNYATFARRVKKLAMQLEDELPIGRLFDIDILDPEGNHIDRVELGGRVRSCLICDKPAKECGRSRAHTVEELQKKTEEMLCNFQDEIFAEKLAELAVRSLLFEVGTTPKPGLVDLRDNGSHKDMDIFSFMSSSAALYSYFKQCAKEGKLAKENKASSKSLFEKLRFEGILAETKMNQATGGVNTHKGAIFSMGILCGAAGKVSKGFALHNPLFLQDEIKAMAAGLAKNDAFTNSTGQKLYQTYGIRGARGEAEDGFPTVFQTGLPMLRKCLESGMTLNEAGVQTLLEILSSTIDTNMIARSDYETARKMQNKINELRNKEGLWDSKIIEALNQEFTEMNLSPGGSADLLSLTYFLHFIFD